MNGKKETGKISKIPDELSELRTLLRWDEVHSRVLDVDLTKN